MGKTCRGCGTPIKWSSDYCNKCAERIKASTKPKDKPHHCANCGITMRPGSRYMYCYTCAKKKGWVS